MADYRVGIVGVRDTGIAFAEAVRERPDMELVGVADLIKDRADSCAQKCETKAYYDGLELFDEGLDIAIIATTNDAHAPLTTEAMNRDIHVICEKPIAVSTKQAEDLVRLQREKGLASVVPFGSSWSPAAVTAKRMIDEGMIGDVLSVWKVRSRGFGYFVEGHRHWAIEFPEKSGQWIAHHAVHDAAWFNKLLGEPKEAFTRGVSTVEGKKSVEEFFSIVTYRSGIHAMVGDGMAPLFYNFGGVNGTKGTILTGWKYLEFQSKSHEHGARPQKVELDPRPAHWLFRDRRGRYHASLNAIVDNIKAGQDKWDGLLAGYNAQRVVAAQTESLDSGNLAPVQPSAF